MKFLIILLVCCLSLIPEATACKSKGKNNQGMQAENNHCEMSNVMFKCRTDRGGATPKNSGSVWDPATAISTGFDQRECIPCCLGINRSISNCEDLSGQLYATEHEENGWIVPSNRTARFGRKKSSVKIKNEDIEETEKVLHCPMDKISRVCRKGSGDRIF